MSTHSLVLNTSVHCNNWSWCLSDVLATEMSGWLSCLFRRIIWSLSVAVNLLFLQKLTFRLACCRASRCQRPWLCMGKHCDLAVPVSADGRKTTFVQRLVKGHSQSLWYQWVPTAVISHRSDWHVGRILHALWHSLYVPVFYNTYITNSISSW